MPRTSTKRARSCPVASFQRMIRGKYKLRIVWDLKDGPLRYSEIRSGLLRVVTGSQEIAPRVLSRELKALTENGLVDRKDYGIIPPKVEYRLTAKGPKLRSRRCRDPRLGRAPPQGWRGGGQTDRRGVTAQFASITHRLCGSATSEEGPLLTSFVARSSTSHIFSPERVQSPASV